MPYTKLLFLLTGLAASSWGQGRTTVEVPANRLWTRTGIKVDRGSTVVIDATGQIEAASNADTRAFVHHVPPEGRERQDNKPQPNMRSLVMLARISDGPIIEAGAHTEFTADRSGELQLGINDDNVSDNTGAWSAQITVRPGATTTSQRGQTQDNSALGGSPTASQNQGRYQNDPGARSSGAAQERPDQYRDNAATRGEPQQRGATNAGPRNGNLPNYQDQNQRSASNPPYGDPGADRYRREDQYRPDYRGSDYYRQYGHGFGMDEAVRVCQQSVLAQASRRFRTPDIHFNRTSVDDSPGRDDWVTGTLDIHRGPRQERYGFSCSVNFDTGRLRTTELDPRPLLDDPRGR